MVDALLQTVARTSRDAELLMDFMSHDVVFAMLFAPAVIGYFIQQLRAPPESWTRIYDFLTAKVCRAANGHL